MKYKFTTSPYGQKNIKMFGVEILDNSIEALREISGTGWNPNEVQMIIDKSKALGSGKRFVYQVEGSDLIISIYSDEVYFHDAHSNQKEADFIWTFDEFIAFMEDFKKFIEENN